MNIQINGQEFVAENITQDKRYYTDSTIERTNVYLSKSYLEQMPATIEAKIGDLKNVTIQYQVDSSPYSISNLKLCEFRKDISTLSEETVVLLAFENN